MRPFLLALLLCAACGAAPPSPPTPEAVVPPALQPVPTPPAGTLLQFFCRETGQLERVMGDGRWLVQLPGGVLAEQMPESYYEPGRPRLGEDGGLRRIREVLASVGFFDLPARVPSPPLPPGALLLRGHGPPEPLAYAFSAADAGGTLHVVEVSGDLRAPETFGVLAPLIQSLDRELWGSWRFE